jgi:hypothetical protein
MSNQTYDGFNLVPNDVKALQELELVLGEEITAVKSASMYNSGFSYENKVVTKLSLRQKNLKQYRDIGITWWLDSVSDWTGNTERIREIIREGPPKL